MKAYKTEIKPTKSQIELIHKTFGCTRYIYNRFVFENLENLTSDKPFVSAFDYSKRVNNDTNTPSWLKEVPSKAIKQALIYADKAFRDYFSKRREKPKFKKKGVNESFYLIGTIKVERHRIFVPKLKWLRLKEFGYIPKNITSVTISMKNGRYYISCLCKDEQDERISLSDCAMGIDFGLKDQFITENKATPSINRSLRVRKLEQRLRREQRKLTRKVEANMIDKVYYQSGSKKGQLKSYKWLKPLSECKNIQVQEIVMVVEYFDKTIENFSVTANLEELKRMVSNSFRTGVSINFPSANPPFSINPRWVKKVIYQAKQETTSEG